MNGTITQQLVSELSRVNSESINKEDSTMATMNENTLTIEQVSPIDINTVPFTIEVNTTKEDTTPKSNATQPNATKTNTKKETKTMNTPKSNATPKATNATKSNTKKETTKVNNAPRTYSRFVYQDELVDAIAANDIVKVRDILSYGPIGKIADKVKEVLYLRPNPERDTFLMSAGKLLSLDYKLSDGSVNQEWIRLASSLIGKDELDAEGNIVRKASSRYNYLMDQAASELPISKKLETGFISFMDCLGKGIAIVGAAGTGVVGNFIAQTIAASYRAKIEIEKTTLSAQIMDAIDPELIQLRATKAQIDALRKMAADAQDKSNDTK